MSRDKQITKIYEPFEITDEMRYLADEMGKAISNEYAKRVLADERKLEAVLKENGWRKASEVVDEVIKRLLDAFPEANRSNKCPAIYYDDYRSIIEECGEELKEKYTEGEK